MDFPLEIFVGELKLRYVRQSLILPLFTLNFPFPLLSPLFLHPNNNDPLSPHHLRFNVDGLIFSS
jgi:hypothetical protein